MNFVQRVSINRRNKSYSTRTPHERDDRGLVKLYHLVKKTNRQTAILSLLISRYVKMASKGCDMKSPLGTSFFKVERIFTCPVSFLGQQRILLSLRCESVRQFTSYIQNYETQILTSSKITKQTFQPCHTVEKSVVMCQRFAKSSLLNHAQYQRNYGVKKNLVKWTIMEVFHNV